MLGGCALIWVVACGGSTTSAGQDDVADGTGGADTASGGTSGDTATSDAGRDSVTGGSGGDSEASGSGGDDTTVSSGGNAEAGGSSGDTATAGSGGSTGGSGGNDVGSGGDDVGSGGDDVGSGGDSVGSGGGTATVPEAGYVDPVPAPDNTWSYPSGDPLNSTPPMLVRLGDGIAIAGATQDPELAGLDAFEEGIESEAFVARLDHDGQVSWSLPLLEAGVPWAVDVDGNGDIVVVAAHLPTTSVLMPSYVSSSIYLAKVDADGAFVFETVHTFDETTVGYAMAAADDGTSFVIGYTDDGIDSALFRITKYDAMGNEVWAHTYPHSGSTAYANGADVAPNGDLVIAGAFNATFDLGGGPLTTTAYSGQWGMPTGLIARFTSDGDHVWSTNFGGPEFDLGMDIIALSDGDLLLGGLISGEATVGGISVSADVEHGQGFTARLDGDGNARWVTLTPNPGNTRFLAVDPDESLVHAVGDYGSTDGSGIDYLYDYDTQGEQILRASAVGGDLYTESAAVDGLSSLWVSGSFRDSIDFGNANLLSTTEAGVFLVRLDRLR